MENKLFLPFQTHVSFLLGLCSMSMRNAGVVLEYVHLVGGPTSMRPTYDKTLSHMLCFMHFFHYYATENVNWFSGNICRFKQTSVTWTENTAATIDVSTDKGESPASFSCGDTTDVYDMTSC